MQGLEILIPVTRAIVSWKDVRSRVFFFQTTFSPVAIYASSIVAYGNGRHLRQNNRHRQWNIGLVSA